MGQHLAHQGPVHAGESPQQHAAHSANRARTEVHYERQINRLDQMRGRSGPGGARRVGAVISERFMDQAQVRMRDRRVESTREPFQRLTAEIERIFGHPYDSNWWRPTVLEWCRANMSTLIQYIDERNQGVAHHHAH